MTPKEKAKELVDKFMKSNNMIFLIKGAKECALIAVDEILSLDIYQSEQWYWQEVKRRIESI